MLLVEDDQGCPVAVQPRWWHRIQVLLRCLDLDRELARGASPDASVELAVRARMLLREATRRSLAQAVIRLLAATGPRPAGRTAQVPVNRQGVRAARPELAALLTRLLDGRPVEVRGLARLSELLSDGTGPLYRAADPLNLAAAFREVLDSLYPLP